MAIDWEQYILFDPEVDRPLAELSAREARRHYDRLIEAKAERIAALKGLVARAGIELDGSDESIQRLNDWFRANVEPDPRFPDRPRGRWFSVTQDIALYFGELLIAQFPHLRWELGKGGKRDISFQRPVIVGFTKAHPSYDVDMDWALGQYAYEIVRGEPVDDDQFLGMLRSAAEFA
jgi:hypothetical protein